MQAFQIDRPRRSPNTGILVLPPRRDCDSTDIQRCSFFRCALTPGNLKRRNSRARARALEAEPLQCFGGGGKGESNENECAVSFLRSKRFLCVFAETNELGSLLGALKGIRNNFIGFFFEFA